MRWKTWADYWSSRNSYPGYGIYTDGLIVHFTAPSIGTVVVRGLHHRQYEVGHRIGNWYMGAFRPLLRGKKVIGMLPLRGEEEGIKYIIENQQEDIDAMCQTLGH